MGYEYADNLEGLDPELDEQLYARHAEIKTFEDLEMQRGTPIPALFNQYYKFIQNPSSVSIETYKRMVDTDDTVGSGVDFLTTALGARIGAYQHPSKEITQFINKALNQIEGGFHNNIKQMLSAVWIGFSDSEKVWQNTDEGFVPRKLVQMPPSTLVFEVERTGEITEDGILQYQRNYNPALSGGINYLFGFTNITNVPNQRVRPDPFAKLGDFPYPLRTPNTYTYMAVRIPRQKVIHYAYDAQGMFGNPYGRSLLRRCHKWWVMKDAFLNMLAVALDRKGTPLQIIFCDPNLTVLDEEKFISGGRPESQGKIRGDLAARRAFKNIHNDTTIFLPGKKGQHYDVEPVQQASNAGDFIQAIQECNKGIMRALLLPSLVFTSGDGSGSYSLGAEHAKTFDKICDGILAGFKQTLIHELVKEMIAYNFPESAWKKDGLGDFSKRELTPDEIDKELGSIEKAVNIGAVDMNDLEDVNRVRDKISFPTLEEMPEKEEVPFDEENKDEPKE